MKKWNPPKTQEEFQRESRFAWEADRMRPIEDALAEYRAGRSTYEQLRETLLRALGMGGIQHLPLQRPWWRF